MTRDAATRQAELERNYTVAELEQERKQLNAQIERDFTTLDDLRKQHSKLTQLLDGNKLNNVELDDLAGHLSLLLEAIARATY
jgi:predicted  nucleic acid-binding Zn-ribbon protein